MVDPRPSPTEYLTAEDVERLHDFIVTGDEDTEPGIKNHGAIEYATSFVREGHFGNKPENIDEAAFELMRLLVANHPFVDGNKRTALLSTVALYALNGFEFEYDREIKTTLKALATDEASVDSSDAIERFEARTNRFDDSGWSPNESSVAVIRRQFRRRRYNADDDNIEE